MKTFEWVPSELEGIWGNGERWCLYQTNHHKGYPHYIGRVYKNHYGGYYQCDVGQYPTMLQAAKALLDKEIE